jgi:hypothetical protein
MRKPRSDSKLLTLPEEQQAQLAEWLLSGLPYHKAKALLEKEFHVVTSLAALSAFWDEVCTPGLLARRQQAVSTADEIAEEARAKPGNFDAATIDAIKQKAFELAVSPRAAPRDVKSLFMLITKNRDQTLKEQQLKLDRERFEFSAAKAALAQLPALRHIAGDKSLDNDSKLLAVRQALFGETPQ